MSTIHSIIRRAASSALLAAIAVAGPAQAVSINVGSYSNTGIGAIGFLARRRGKKS